MKRRRKIGEQRGGGEERGDENASDFGYSPGGSCGRGARSQRGGGSAVTVIVVAHVTVTADVRVREKRRSARR